MTYDDDPVLVDLSEIAALDDLTVLNNPNVLKELTAPEPSTKIPS